MLEFSKKARVIEILLDKYILEDLENKNIKIEATLRGNVKRKGNILVGDYVVLEKSYDKFLINDIIPRNNFLVRPPVANIDNMIIVTSISNPKPDYMLLDKQIVLCMSRGITSIICVNKMDLIDIDNTLEDEVKYIESVYGNLGIKVIYISAKNGDGILELKEILKNKTSAFSGNSGVGKSSITKQIVPEEEKNIATSDVGIKSNKGKHTTKYIKLYNVFEDSYVLDTPGFSSFELYDITYKELKNYFFEFNSCICEYDNCNHVREDEKVCEVKRRVKLGEIDRGRYERYVYMYEKLKEQDERKYK